VKIEINYYFIPYKRKEFADKSFSYVLFVNINEQVQFSELRHIEYSVYRHTYEYEIAYEKQFGRLSLSISSSNREVYFLVCSPINEQVQFSELRHIEYSMYRHTYEIAYEKQFSQLSISSSNCEVYFLVCSFRKRRNVKVQYTEPRRIEYSVCQHICEYKSAYEKKNFARLCLYLLIRL